MRKETDKVYEINFNTIPDDLEPNEDISLWRYMSWSSLFDILMYDLLPLINVRKFSDKAEGAILKTILTNLSKSNRAFTDDIDVIEYIMHEYYKTTYISSWCQSEAENAAMWDRYTHGSSEGVAIKTNAKLLLDRVKSNNNITPNNHFSDAFIDSLPGRNNRSGVAAVIPDIIIKPVKYTEINPKNFIMKFKYLENGYDRLCFYYKLQDFRDESEIRISFSTGGPKYTHLYHNFDTVRKLKEHERQRKSNRDSDSILIYIDSANKLIEQIVVSPHSHEGAIKRIKDLIECINLKKQDSEFDLIDCDIVESGRKEWT